MDLVNENLVDLVHDAIGFLRAKLLHKRRKTLHVAEHDRDLLAFALDFTSLGQDFVSQALGKISLNFVYFLIKGEVFGNWFGRDGQVVAALTAEFVPRKVFRFALRTDQKKLSAALSAKLAFLRVISLTLWALHY